MIILNRDRMACLLSGTTLKVDGVELSLQVGRDTLKELLDHVPTIGPGDPDRYDEDAEREQNGTADGVPADLLEDTISEETVDALRTKVDAIALGSKMGVDLDESMKLTEMQDQLMEGLTRFREQGV